MEKTGLVVELIDDLAVVDVIRPSECGDKCSNCSGSCNVKYMTVKVQNDLDARIGDSVALQLTSTQFVASTFQLYTIPLIAFIIGLFLGYSQHHLLGLTDQNIAGLLMGFALMAISVIFVSQLTSRRAKERGGILTMSQVIRRDDVIQ